MREWVRRYLLLEGLTPNQSFAVHFTYAIACVLFVATIVYAAHPAN